MSCLHFFNVSDGKLLHLEQQSRGSDITFTESPREYNVQQQTYDRVFENLTSPADHHELQRHFGCPYTTTSQPDLDSAMVSLIATCPIGPTLVDQESLSVLNKVWQNRLTSASTVSRLEHLFAAASTGHYSRTESIVGNPHSLTDAENPWAHNIMSTTTIPFSEYTVMEDPHSPLPLGTIDVPAPWETTKALADSSREYQADASISMIGGEELLDDKFASQVLVHDFINLIFSLESNDDCATEKKDEDTSPREADVANIDESDDEDSISSNGQEIIYELFDDVSVLTEKLDMLWDDLDEDLATDNSPFSPVLYSTIFGQVLDCLTRQNLDEETVSRVSISLPYAKILEFVADVCM